MIVFDVGKHWFGIITTLFAFLYTPFTGQAFLRLLFEAIKIMIDFYDPVVLTRIALFLQGAAFAFFGLITGNGLPKPGSVILFKAANIFHCLA